MPRLTGPPLPRPPSPPRGLQLLREKLASQATPSRVVVLASNAHRMGTLDLADLHFRGGRAYSPWGAYGQSKTANILFAKVRR